MKEIKTLTTKIEFDDKKTITPKFRLSFPALFKPKSFKGNDPKFSIVMLFDKEIDLHALKQAAHNAACEKWGTDKSKWPSKKVKSKKTPGKIINQCIVKMPFRDGDLEKPDSEGYENCIFVGASSKKPPGICDKKLQPIISESTVNAGDYGMAEIVAFAYDDAGNVGVSFSLLNYLHMEKGESLSGKRNAAEVFKSYAVDDSDDDESNSEESEENEDEISY